MASEDPYGRLSYPGLIAWPERLQREAALVGRVLASAPSRVVLDLGCGSGEHARFLAAQGFAVTGVDASPSQLAAAQAADPGGRYVEASLTDLGAVKLPRHGAALCLGNTLPHLLEATAVRAFLAGLSACLEPGAPLLLQLLNYDRILDRHERAFPVVLRPGAEGQGETVFLRLMTHHGEGRLTFTPAHLRHQSGSEPPLELVAAQEVPLQGWRRHEVEAFLVATGFRVAEVLGSMTGDPWAPTGSDLVVIATRL